MNLKDWEIKTIEALAQEAFDRESQKIEIRHPEAWLEKAIRDRQEDAIRLEPYRKQLLKHAERLGVGHVQPPRVTADDPLGYEVSDQATRDYWIPIILEKIHRIGAPPTKKPELTLAERLLATLEAA